jgi:NADPH-ferrihemoprotein reductase
MDNLISNGDIYCFQTLATATIAYGIHRAFSRLRAAPAVEPLFPQTSQSVAKQAAFPVTRSIKKALDYTSRQCIIFYGSQTGTAEKLAMTFGSEAKTRFGLESIVADINDYDYDDLRSMPRDAIVVFIMATYGEGEPTDSAIPFSEFLDSPKSKGGLDFAYAAFGLGSSAYQHFNSMIKRVDSVLTEAGAERVGIVGFGDDAQDTTEDSFLAWREDILLHLATRFSLKKQEYIYQPLYEVSEQAEVTSDTFLGEPNRAQLKGKFRGPYTANNPLPARISTSRNLFSQSDRDCLHIEFDTSASTLTYETGDHLAVWPVNADAEVDRFLTTFGLQSKQDTVVLIKSRDPTVKVQLPERTTYIAAARYYLDINASVSRPFLTSLAATVKEPSARAKLIKTSSDTAVFQQEVKSRQLNLAQYLSSLGEPHVWADVPFSLILENVGKLKPRYYSISSSSVVSRKTISITSVVDKRKDKEWNHEFNGVATNYLLAATAGLRGEPDASNATHHINGPRGIYADPTVFINIRKSKFRLPKNDNVPIIMIGPGTGVAPFRAFVQERALRAQAGKNVGRTMLFYGCRRKDEDFLYANEWSVSSFAMRSDLF